MISPKSYVVKTLKITLFIFKVVRGFIDKLEQVSDDPTLKEEMEAQVKITNAEPNKIQQVRSYFRRSDSSKFNFTFALPYLLLGCLVGQLGSRCHWRSVLQVQEQTREPAIKRQPVR